MKIKPVIFGATGMVGQGVLRECLLSENVESILVVNRRTINIQNEKVREIIVKDFSNLETNIADFAQYNCCFFCLGISSVGMTENDYYKITYEITINVAEALIQTKTPFTFCFVSGAGTDSTESGKSMWARVKGKTENKLLSLPFKDAYMFRPGFIEPLNGIKSRTKLYNTLYIMLKPIVLLIKIFTSIGTNTTAFGKAMINVSMNGYEKKILTNDDINKLGK